MKKNIIAFIIFSAISAIVLVFGDKFYDIISVKYFINNQNNNFLYGSKTGTHGKISVKLRVDETGSIKEVYVLEHPDNDIANNALQKLIYLSLDKQSADEIDTISGATETSDVYKGIISKLLVNNMILNDETDIIKISLTDKDIADAVERKAYNQEGLKSGIGGYVINSFQDADSNRNGSLVTNEFICAVVLNNNNRIEDVKFDHISSNISFDKYGRVPTGDAREFPFLSDKIKPGFYGLINEGSSIDIFEFENDVLELRYFEDVKTMYINKKGYAPFIYALEKAIDNARYIGASNGDTLGLSSYKTLKKTDITDSTEDENGSVNFLSNYAMITVDKDKKITSAMFDNVTNNVILTSDGEVLGDNQKEISTLNELSNVSKYSKIDIDKYNMKIQYNNFADFIRNYDIDSVLRLISNSTNNKGCILENGPLNSFNKIDFIEFIDIITNAYVDAVKIRR